MRLVYVVFPCEIPGLKLLNVKRLSGSARRAAWKRVHLEERRRRGQRLRDEHASVCLAPHSNRRTAIEGTSMISLADWIDDGTYPL